MTYRDRRIAKAARLRGWSASNEARAEQRQAGADAIADMIPFGQPILAGHHSEKRHRADLARIESGTRASIDLSDKAAEQAARADNIEAATEHAIYDDDPDACERLAAKLARLEAQREQRKEANRVYRAAHPELKTMSAYERGQAVPYPAYAISNLGGVIKATRDRLARLQRQQANGGPPDRLITARYPGACADCGATIERGATIRYNRQQGARCATPCDRVVPDDDGPTENWERHWDQDTLRRRREDSAMNERYELTISSGNDSSSGVYETRAQAIDAADEAAQVDGLTARYGNHRSGCFVDNDGMAWFHFAITPEKTA